MEATRKESAQLSKINGLLEEIQKVNLMIEKHATGSANDELMIRQYQSLRAGFVIQLNKALKTYHLTIQLAIQVVSSKKPISRVRMAS